MPFLWANKNRGDRTRFDIKFFINKNEKISTMRDMESLAKDVLLHSHP